MLMPSIFGENLFEDFMRDFSAYDDGWKRAEKKLYGHHARQEMKTDIKETDTGYELEMDLPGYKKEEVKAAIENGYLTISATKGLEENEEKKDGTYIRRERYLGTCERSFYVGENLTESDIKAEFKDGILRLFVPKKEAVLPENTRKYIAID